LISSIPISKNILSDKNHLRKNTDNLKPEHDNEFNKQEMMDQFNQILDNKLKLMIKQLNIPQTALVADDKKLVDSFREKHKYDGKNNENK